MPTLIKLSLSAVVTFATLACQRGSSDEAAESAKQAVIIYADACKRCHGAVGQGGVVEDTKAQARDFTDVAYQSGRTDEQFRQAIAHGTKNMPAFGDQYSAEQLKALVRHIRGFKGKSKP
jgi:mono/diheme cytochrome c family protein